MGLVINPEQQVRDLFVLGASAGGLEALTGLVRNLPSELAATVAIVMHRSPTFESQLPVLLGLHSALPVGEPAEDEEIRHGRIYIAPRDRHMTLAAGRFRLAAGPKVNWARPAVDPLFVSAARELGPRSVGILLSGEGSDGVEGLIAIKAAGGLSIAQDPVQARHPSMPIRALHKDDVDAIMPVEEIAEAVSALAAGHRFEPRGEVFTR